MNTWIVGKDLMKTHFEIKTPFTENSICKIFLAKIICMLKEYLKKLNQKT